MRIPELIILILVSLIAIDLNVIGVSVEQDKTSTNDLNTTIIPNVTLPTRKCYSAFDIYMTNQYELSDKNATLTTSLGRVYNEEDCKEIQ